jgi:soluble lytic murein transglycosylase-like protein
MKNIIRKISIWLLILMQIGLNIFFIYKFKDLTYQRKLIQERLENLISVKEKENEFIQKYLSYVEKYVSDRTIAIRILRAVFENSEKYQIPPELILSMIKVESHFNKDAFSQKNAIGLMQILPETAELVANYINKPLYDLWKIEDNIEIGVTYLYLLQKYYSLDEAIRRYYAGKNHHIEEAQKYYQKICEVYKELK